MKGVWMAGLVGGIVGFLWGAISHMVLPLGTIGIDTMPNEGPIVDAMRSLPSDGLYFFPGEGFDENPKSPAYAAWVAKLRSGPRGLLIFHPKGAEPMMPSQLLLEFLADVGGALIAAWLLARVVGSYAFRTTVVAALGIFAWLSISASYWIWYGFPGDYSLAQLADSFLGWLVVGLVIARMVSPPALPPATPPTARPI
ncbi:MAG: hypothetical protein U0167_10185 [bacterium]